MKSLLAGYISGAGVDLAQVRLKGERLELYNEAHFKSQDYHDLDSILKLYLKKKSPVDAACFGVAGPVIRNEVSTTNLPWHIVGSKIEQEFSIGQVKLVNDIVATAHGLSLLSSEKFYILNEGRRGDNGNLGLIAPGVGLGEALVYCAGGKRYPYASEGGHADFAPNSQLETELWQYLYAELGNVEVEDVLSLTGLERIYNFLVDTQGGERAAWIDEAEIPAYAVIEKALAGEDQTATQTVDLFIDCLASEAGNLALTGMTLGGIYIGGRIIPQVITAIDRGRFMQRFAKQGKMEGLLANTPVGIVIEQKTALLGAAGITTSS